MLSRIQFLCVMIFACALSSCATHRAPATSYQYREPIKAEIVNEAVVRLPYSDTWDLMVGQLAKSFFVINNVEKASRIINISFATDKPEEYVDCGTAERTFKYGKESQAYTYPVAGASSFKSAGSYNTLSSIGHVRRTTSLEGRINIYMVPKESDTIVTVNTRYVLTARTSEQVERRDAFGAVVQISVVPEKVAAVSFNTAQSGTADWGTSQVPEWVTCRSTGRIEAEILAMSNH